MAKIRADEYFSCVGWVTRHADETAAFLLSTAGFGSPVRLGKAKVQPISTKFYCIQGYQSDKS